MERTCTSVTGGTVVTVRCEVLRCKHTTGGSDASQCDSWSQFVPGCWTRAKFDLRTEHRPFSPESARAPKGPFSNAQNHINVWATSNSRRFILETIFHHCTCKRFMVTTVAIWNAETFLCFLKRKWKHNKPHFSLLKANKYLEILNLWQKKWEHREV